MPFIKPWITLTAAVLCSLLLVPKALAQTGVVDVPSQYSFEETHQRLLKTLESKGLTLFADISHSDGAKSVGLSLDNSRVVIFGNPKIGTPLMTCKATVALDLPQKILIHQDANGQVWLAYNNPTYLKERHNITGCDEVLGKISKALAGITQKAAGEPK